MDKETNQQLSELMEVECKSKSTITSYQHHIDKFTKYYGKHPEQKYIIKHLWFLKKFKNYDKSSLNVAKSALKYYYEEVLNEEITIKLPRIKRRKSIPKFLPREIIKQLIESRTNFKHRLLVELGYDTGLRPEELVSLEWSDVNWDDKIININRGKGDKDRVAYVSDNVMIHLKDHKEFQKKKNPNCKYIFDSMYRPDYHICKRTYEEILNHAAEKIKTDLNIYPYRIRHSFATHLTDIGVPVEKIQPRMGHSNIKTTMIYAKIAKPKERPVTLMDDKYFADNKIIRNSG